MPSASFQAVSAGRIRVAICAGALFAAAIYWVHGDIEYDIHHRSMSPTAIAHGSALLALLFVVKAWSYVLDRYLLLYGDNGVVVGASYTDVKARMPGLHIAAVAALAAAGAMETETAFDIAKWSGLPLTAFYGFCAARLSGMGLPAAFLQATTVAAIGGFLIGLKALVH